MLGGLTQHVERLDGGDPLTLHQDALGLADEFAGDQCGLEVLSPALFVLVVAGDRQRESGHRGQQESTGPVHHTEGVREPGVEDQRTDGGVAGQRERQGAPHPEGRRLRTERGPAGVVAELSGIEGGPVLDGVETGSFVAPQLTRIRPGGRGVRARPGDEVPVVDEEHTGGLARLQGGDREDDGPVQAVLDAGRAQEVVGDVGELDRRLERCVLGGAGISCSGLHSASLGRPAPQCDTDRARHRNSHTAVAVHPGATVRHRIDMDGCLRLAAYTVPMARTDVTKERSLRADAEQNRARIVGAAQELFAEHGINVTMEEVARRAGVGVATLYRRFPTRSDLLAGAFEDKMRLFADGARRALEDPDPWHGFCRFVTMLCAMQADDRGFNDVLTMTFPKVTGFESARNEGYVAVAELVRQAQDAGALRKDFVPEDLIILLMANAGVVAATGKVAPRSAPRLVGYLLQAFAAPGEDDLPPPPSYRQVTKALLRFTDRID